MQDLKGRAGETVAGFAQRGQIEGRGDKDVERQSEVVSSEDLETLAKQPGMDISEWQVQHILNIERLLGVLVKCLDPTLAGVSIPSDDGWINSEQAGAYLGMTPKAVGEGALRGDLPGHKYPQNSKRGQWMFKRSELDECLKRGRKTTPRKGVSIW